MGMIDRPGGVSWLQGADDPSRGRIFRELRCKCSYNFPIVTFVNDVHLSIRIGNNIHNATITFQVIRKALSLLIIMFNASLRGRLPTFTIT